MFSSKILIEILHSNLCDPYGISCLHYEPTYSCDSDLISNWAFYTNIKTTSYDCTGFSLFYAEEPLDFINLQNSLEYDVNLLRFNVNKPTKFYTTDWSNSIQLFANSEISHNKNKFCRKNELQDWYFFYHGYAALDWFSHFKYFPTYDCNSFDYVFITYNNLVNLKRSYRLTLIAELFENNLADYGLISMPKIYNNFKVIKDEIFSPHSQLSIESKKLILKNLKNVDRHLIIDKENVTGELSAYIPFDYNYKALWQIVTETVFYDESLHLTEKIFKPIVCRQPFILVGAYNNLKYLKQYGFKTFDKWIDESYDNEPNNDSRIHLIVKEIAKLCKLTKKELLSMYYEMKSILDYNYNHFYGNFKNIIVNETVDNFKNCITKYNFELPSRYKINPEFIDFDEVKQRLMK